MSVLILFINFDKPEATFNFEQSVDLMGTFIKSLKVSYRELL